MVSNQLSPSGWKSIKLAEVSSIKRGAGSQYLQYTDSPSNETIRLIRISDFLGDSPKYVKKTKDIQRFILEKGDILIAGTGATAGIVFEIPDKFSGLAFSYNAPRIRVKHDTDNKFIGYYLQSSNVLRQQKALFTGNAQPFLDTKAIGGFKIKLPPLSEQKKIAQILSTWDKAITTTEQLLANSQQQKKALMQQLLTGKKRLLDENGVRFSGEWQVSSLVTVAEVTMGSSPKSASYNESKIGLPLLQGNADLKSRLSAPRIYTSQITKECQPGDILLSVRAPVGSVGLSQHHACIGRGISAIKAKQYNSQAFLYQWLLWFEPKWEALSQGSTFESINGNDIKNILLHIPTHREQLKIASILSVADKEINALKQNLSSLKNEKKALMQQLLTGKRRVKVDEEAA